ncbi:Dethiobiotin synthetase [Halomicronema hongdechloris]|nr:Dethiobiotin synthetase [Halomicronema hongdechloris]
MDFETARQVLLQQTIAPAADKTTTFIHCLQQQQPPVPGQVTSLLLALKVLRSGLQGEPTLGRDLAYALFLVAYESRRLYEAGRQAGWNGLPSWMKICSGLGLLLKQFWPMASPQTNRPLGLH